MLQALAASDSRLTELDAALCESSQERQWLSTRLEGLQATTKADAAAAAERLADADAAGALARELGAADRAELGRLRSEAKDTAALRSRCEEERSGRARAETELEAALQVQAELQSRHASLATRCEAVVSENEALLFSGKAEEERAAAALRDLRAAAVAAREEAGSLRREVSGTEMRSREVSEANALLSERCALSVCSAALEWFSECSAPPALRTQLAASRGCCDRASRAPQLSGVGAAQPRCAARNACSRHFRGGGKGAGHC